MRLHTAVRYYITKMYFTASVGSQKLACADTFGFDLRKIKVYTPPSTLPSYLFLSFLFFSLSLSLSDICEEKKRGKKERRENKLELLNFFLRGWGEFYFSQMYQI